MDKLKQWVALTVVACLAVSAAGWFLLVSPKRTEAAELRTQTEDQNSANAKLETELQVLKAQAKDLPKEQAKLAAVAAKIPDNPGLPSLVRALLEAAEVAEVELVSITPSDPALRAPVVPTAPVAQGTAQQTPDAGAAGTAPAAPAPSPAGQLADIPVSINVVGDYFQVQRFLTAAEELTRALRVETLDIVPGLAPSSDQATGPAAMEEGRSLSATLNGYVFMAANRPAPFTATVPGVESAPADAVAVDPASAAQTADAAN
jgi:Tfp pilus assembly protein PilO